MTSFDVDENSRLETLNSINRGALLLLGDYCYVILTTSRAKAVYDGKEIDAVNCSVLSGAHGRIYEYCASLYSYGSVYILHPSQEIVPRP